MTNPYYTAGTLTRHTLARAGDVNAQLSAIEAGFDLLPTVAQLFEGSAVYVSSGGSANVYTAAMSKTLTVYSAGQVFNVLINTTNTGASTINVDGLGAKSIKRSDGTNVEAGDLTAGEVIALIYDGTDMTMLNTPRSHMAGIASNLGADLVFSGDPSFTGTASFSNIDVNGGAIDGAPVGSASASTGAFTTLTASGTSILSGSVGIGETSPDASLHINSGTADIGLVVESTDANSSMVFTDSGGSTMLRNSGGAFQFFVGGAAGSTSASGSSITASITSAGNFGIGDTTPDQRLVVSRLGSDLAVTGVNGSTALLVHPGTANSTSGAFIAAIGGTGSGGGITFGTPTDSDRGQVYYHNPDDSMRLWTNGVEKIRILSDGRVGINETDPLYQLHIKNDDVGTMTGLDATTDVLIESANCTLSLIGSTTGSSRIMFGDAADGTVGHILYDHTSNYMRFNVNTAESMRINSSGIQIGQSTTVGPGYGNTVEGAGVNVAGRISSSISGSTALTINRNGSDGIVQSMYRQGASVGSISVTTTGTTYNTTSDERLKTNITTKPKGASGPVIDSLSVREFDWIADGSHQDFGVIAQEVQAVYPDAVSVVDEETGYLGVDYSQFVPLLLQEVQELRQRVAQLEAAV